MSKHLQYGSFLFILCIAFAISWQTFTVVNFYTHQNEIEAEYCVNKDKPELNCHGKCHLEKQLNNAVVTEKNLPTSLTQSLLFFCGLEDVEACAFCQPSSLEPSNFHFNRPLLEGSLSDLLDPPEIS